MGGIFTGFNKVRPGAYTNVKGLPSTTVIVGDRGIASLPLVLKWGIEETMILIDEIADFKNLLGYDIGNVNVLLAAEAFKRASSLLVYRPNNDGDKATVTAGNLTATGKYTGTRGNDITIVIVQNVDTVTFDVQTLVDGIVEDEQLQKAVVADLTDNIWVDFTGTGVLTTTAGSPLISGTDGTAVAGDYTAYLAALELVDFNTFGYPGTDSGIKAAFDVFTNTLRDTDGVKAQCVLTSYDGDFEGLINVTNGVILADTTEISADQAVAWVTGATAAAQINESLTFDAYDDSVDANPRRTNSDTITRLENGEFMFTAKNGRAVVEQDINSLVNVPGDKNDAFKKNRVIRVIDELVNGTTAVFEDDYIGKVGNNATGQDRLKADVVALYNSFLALGAIKDFTADTDVLINTAASTGDQVVIDEIVTPVDSIEKIYQTIFVKEG